MPGKMGKTGEKSKMGKTGKRREWVEQIQSVKQRNLTKWVKK